MRHGLSNFVQDSKGDNCQDGHAGEREGISTLSASFLRTHDKHVSHRARFRSNTTLYPPLQPDRPDTSPQNPGAFFYHAMLRAVAVMHSRPRKRKGATPQSAPQVGTTGQRTDHK